MQDWVRLLSVDGLIRSGMGSWGNRVSRLTQSCCAICLIVALSFAMLSVATGKHSKRNNVTSHFLTAPQTASLTSRSLPRLANLPIAFEMNRGQAPSDAAFMARAESRTVFLKSSGTEFRVPRRD